MAHVILSGVYGNARYGRGMLGAIAPTATSPQPLAKPVAASPVAAMQALAPTSAPPTSPPPEAKEISAGVFLDMTRGDLWFNGTRIAILSAVVSALAVKMVFFGGNKLGALAKGQMARFKGEAAKVEAK